MSPEWHHGIQLLPNHGGQENRFRHANGEQTPFDRLSTFRSTSIGDHHHAKHAVVFVQEIRLFSNLLFQELRVTTVFNHHLLHHLTNDDLEVLVVDFHTLETVDVLNLITMYS